MHGRDFDSPERPRKRLDSPSDAFKEVFNEYGAKLSPELMRLQIEGGELPYAENPDCDGDGQSSPSRKGKVHDVASDDESDKEEEAFLATQR